MLERQTKLLRRMAIGAGMYCSGALGVMAWPASGWLAGGLAAAYMIRKGKRRLSAMGTARWADRSDLTRAGMLNAKSGLILGRMPRTRELIRLPQAVHISIFAPSGAGKGVSLIIPFLLQSAASAVVVDFKGELWKETAEHRRKEFGHQIVALDPFHSVTDTPDTIDPIGEIEKDDPQAIDSCNDLSSALVIKTGEEKEPHWNSSAEMYIAGIAAAVVAFGEKAAGTRSIQMVRETLVNPRRLDSTIQLMMKEGDDALAQMGSQLTHFAGEEKSSVLTTVNRHLTFLGSPAVMASTKASSFDPRQLRRGKMTVYLILPPERAAAQAGLMRMWISSLMRACVREGLQ